MFLNRDADKLLIPAGQTLEVLNGQCAVSGEGGARREQGRRFDADCAGEPEEDIQGNVLMALLDVGDGCSAETCTPGNDVLAEAGGSPLFAEKASELHVQAVKTGSHGCRLTTDSPNVKFADVSATLTYVLCAPSSLTVGFRRGRLYLLADINSAEGELAMAKGKGGQSVHVTPRDGGRAGWATKTGGADRAEGIYPTQRQAEERGREILDRRGGGELVTHDRDGVIRSKDTIGRADPFPPRDTEH